MQFLNCVVALAIISLGTVAALPTDLPFLRPTAVGEINGTAFSMQGTIPEVIAAIEAKHPGYLAAQPKVERLVKRNKNGMVCNRADWTGTLVENIRDSAEDLLATPLSFSISPRTCFIIACNSGGSAIKGGIYLCHDNDYLIQPGMQYLGSYAMDIADQCPGLMKSGQEFDSDNYNVIAKGGCDGLL